MMVLLISIINIVLLFGTVYVTTKKLLAGPPAAILFFVSVVVSLTLLSFFYYVLLILKQDFNILLICLTLINLVNIYCTLPGFRKLFKGLKTLPSNYDIIPALAILLMSVFFVVYSSKYGFFDGWALWNSHAKFLYDTTLWTNMFADRTYESSSDYPLMLPALVAFFWHVVSNTTFIIPLLSSFLFLMALPLILYYALKNHFKNKFFAIIALTLLVADYNFQMFNSEQCADILLSVFILMTFVIYNYLNNKNIASVAYVLGFICASGMWIKNEGELFYLVFSVGFVFCNYKNPAYLKKFFIGSVLPLAVTFGFKELYAPPTDFFSSNHNSIPIAIAHLKDLSRYSLIATLYVKLLINGFWIGLTFIFSVIFINRGFFRSFGFAVLFIMLLGYTFVFLISPYNLTWHISNTFHRLINQIYPSLIFTSLISFGRKYPGLTLIQDKQDTDVTAKNNI